MARLWAQRYLMFDEHGAFPEKAFSEEKKSCPQTKLLHPRKRHLETRHFQRRNREEEAPLPLEPYHCSLTEKCEPLIHPVGIGKQRRGKDNKTKAYVD